MTDIKGNNPMAHVVLKDACKFECICCPTITVTGRIQTDRPRISPPRQKYKLTKVYPDALRDDGYNHLRGIGSDVSIIFNDRAEYQFSPRL